MYLVGNLDILRSDQLHLKSKITKGEHKEIFCGPSKIFKNISWPINICLRFFMPATPPPPPPPPEKKKISLAPLLHTLCTVPELRLTLK